MNEREVLQRWGARAGVRDDAALRLVGFPLSHKPAIARVALDNKVCILSREVGGVCTGLIEAGHDTKGFRIHAKSCDWGPMAGFVCRTPEYNKKGLAGRRYNTEQHDEALNDTNHAGWSASTTPLIISNERRVWLMAQGIIRPTQKGRSLWEGVSINRGKGGSITCRYQLRPASPPAPRDHWALHHRRRGGWEPILGMVNPYPAWPTAGPHAHLNAVTGDYDLFAIWPEGNKFVDDLSGKWDMRLSGMGPNITNDQIVQNENKQLGNISDRVQLIAQCLNSAIGTVGGGYAKRSMVHHSDEGGRPFVNDVDLPLIGFVPTPSGRVEVFGMSSVEHVQHLVKIAANLGYVIFLNRGWTRQLGDDFTMPQPGS